MGVHLKTQRLVLRHLTAADVDNLVELDADAEAMHFVTGGPPTPRDEIEKVILPEWLAYYITRSRHISGSGRPRKKAAGRFIGWFHFRPGEEHTDDEPELGYRLRRSTWGRATRQRVAGR